MQALVKLFAFILIFGGCKNIAFLSAKKAHNRQQEIEITKVNGEEVKFTESELNLASDYLTALSIYLTEMKTQKKKNPDHILKCDPEFNKISPWSMHIMSLLESGSHPIKAAVLTDCYSSDDKRKECKSTFQSFCDSELHKVLLKL